MYFRQKTISMYLNIKTKQVGNLNIKQTMYFRRICQNPNQSTNYGFSSKKRCSNHRPGYFVAFTASVKIHEFWLPDNHSSRLVARFCTTRKLILLIIVSICSIYNTIYKQQISIANNTTNNTSNSSRLVARFSTNRSIE